MYKGTKDLERKVEQFGDEIRKKWLRQQKWQMKILLKITPFLGRGGLCFACQNGNHILRIPYKLIIRFAKSDKAALK